MFLSTLVFENFDSWVWKLLSSFKYKSDNLPKIACLIFFDTLQVCQISFKLDHDLHDVSSNL